jgi:hypothetical protein
VNEIELYIHEYAGLRTASPFEDSSAMYFTSPGCGMPDCMASGVFQATASSSLIFGFGVSNVVNAGTGFAARSTYNSNVTEDRVVTHSGMYQATGTPTGGLWQLMIGAAFAGQ